MLNFQRGSLQKYIVFQHFLITLKFHHKKEIEIDKNTTTNTITTTSDAASSEMSGNQFKCQHCDYGSSKRGHFKRHLHIHNL